MSFFSEVQSWFCAGYGYEGRYLGKIIIEWAKDDPTGFRSYFDNKVLVDCDSKLPPNYRVKAEFPYKPDRYADLAIFANDLDVVPIILIELKWNDKLRKNNNKPIENKETGRYQLNDYVDYCLQHETCNLLVLTKDALTLDEDSKISNLGVRGRHQYFSDLSPSLNSSRSTVAKMLLDYLKDKGVVMNDIDQGNLFRFFHRFVNPCSGSGKTVSEYQLSEGPEHFKNLLNNMSLIAQDISPAFYSIKGVNRKATVDFAFRPWALKKELRKALDDEDASEEIVLYPKSRSGGEFFIFASETIGSSPWRQIEYGFRLIVVPNKAHTISISIYACLNGDNSEDTTCDDDAAAIKQLVFKEGHKKKAEIVKKFRKLISELIEKTISKDLVNSDLKISLKEVGDALKL